MTNGTLGVIAAFAKGMPVKIISAEATGAPDAFWYARPESGIKSIKDTNGKTVAFSSPGSSTNLIILQLINQEKATPKLVATGGAPGNADAGDDRPDRRRLVGAAVRAAAARRRAACRSSRAAATSRRSTNQTIRVNVANANALKEKRDAFVRYMRALSRAIDWAYSGAAAIDAYAALAKVPRALAQRTRDEFYPKDVAAARRGQGARPHAEAGAGVQVHHRAARRRGRAEGADRYPAQAVTPNRRPEALGTYGAPSLEGAGGPRLSRPQALPFRWLDN